MRLILLPDGTPAWVCDTGRWANDRENHRELQEWNWNSPEGKLPGKIFGQDVEE
jgi:hypothetical protein